MRSASRPYTSVTWSRCVSGFARMNSNILCSPSPGSLLDDNIYRGYDDATDAEQVYSRFLSATYSDIRVCSLFMNAVPGVMHAVDQFSSLSTIDIGFADVVVVVAGAAVVAGATAVNCFSISDVNHVR